MENGVEQENKINNDNFIATLGFIQNIITRMATMCTICKICTITIVTALIIAGFSNTPKFIFFIIALIIIVMAIIDSLYLFRERNYIGQYNQLVEEWRKGEIPRQDYFKVTIGSLKRHPYNKKGCPLISNSIYLFYGLLLAIDL